MTRLLLLAALALGFLSGSLWLFLGALIGLHLRAHPTLALLLLAGAGIYILD
ncbi:hypothetical protein [Pseudohaliea sp.]|uniref:hypothetical protein n=1 Tax=Pseudohaliea sp. TaxID=2740289 RepID=UPI0032EF5B31